MVDTPRDDDDDDGEDARPRERARRLHEAALDEAIRSYAAEYGPGALFESLSAWQLLLAATYPAAEVVIDTDDGRITIRPRR